MTDLVIPPLVNVPRCPVCSGEGAILYDGLRDRLGDLPGEWRFRRCNAADCGHLWMDPAIQADHLGWAYQDYFTHDGGALPSVSRLGPLGATLREAGHWLSGLGPEWRRRKALLVPAVRPFSPGHGQGNVRLRGVTR